MNKYYENRYIKFILPEYGSARDNNNDKLLIASNNKNHNYCILDRTDFTQISVYSVDPPVVKMRMMHLVFIQQNKLYLIIHIADLQNILI